MLLTASSDWSAWQPRARARLDWLQVRRLAAFIAVSIALHALTFGSYRPGSGAQEGIAEPAGARVLRAALVHEQLPEQLGSEHQTPAAQRQQDAASVPARVAAKSQAADSGADGMVQMPMPERWYEAAELDRRAEPLTPVEPAYPPELASLAAAPATVRLRLFIDERGTVRKLEIALPGPRPEFDEAAKRAWQGVRFSPAIKDGTTVKSQKLLELAFAP